GIRDAQTFPLIFYRQDCADMGLNESDIDDAYIAKAKSVVLSGTHFSTRTTAAASRKAALACRKAGGRVAIDIDYRPVLWGIGGHGSGEERYIASDRVTEHLQDILPLCDLLVGTQEELHIAGGTTNTLAAIKAVRQKTDAAIVCKRGPMGCVVFPGAIPDDIEQGIIGPGFRVEVFNVLGAGDAFMSGFLRGWLRDEPWETCARYANACGAFAVSRHGCTPAYPTWEELSAFLTHGSPHKALRFDTDLNHIHWATTRRKAHKTVMALAIDHRAQFEEMAEGADVPIERVGGFKMLALEAVRQVADGRPGFGVLLDERLGRDALHCAMEGDLWVGRPVEIPGSRPLKFEGGADIGGLLAQWPVDQVVKCLVFYHPDDPGDLRHTQEQKIITLFQACRRSGHEFLLEVISSKHGDIKTDTIARALTRFYDLGVRPDWWKLEPAGDAETWEAITHAISSRDPHCRGIVILGLEASQDDLLKSFAIAAQFDLVKGFAVGRTIFADVAQDWLAGKLGDDAARDTMAQRFKALAQGWMRLRTG
ncbi:MAG: bifunctional 5-dehydro-2-deoxygluconokinase/5-dehydro-2-deoxyphosphogluconate aldolase, partial [Alphaproteobacteria bacterium]